MPVTRISGSFWTEPRCSGTLCRAGRQGCYGTSQSSTASPGIFVKYRSHRLPLIEQLCPDFTKLVGYILVYIENHHVG
jgi:hypothetical protein